MANKINRDEIAEFLASLKKMRDGLDGFNHELSRISGAGKRLGLLCEATAAACPPAEIEASQALNGTAHALHVFSGETGEILQNFLASADVFSRCARQLEIEGRKGSQ